MTSFRFWGAGVLLLALAASAWGHGFELSLSGNSLIVTTDDDPVLHNDLFRHSIAATPDANAFTVNHGLFSRSVPPFGSGDTFRFDVVGPLWYSNGGTATAARSGVTMQAFENTTDPSPDFYGSFNGQSSGLTAGGELPGTSSHAVQWLLEFDNFQAADEGVYGFAYEISALQNGDPGAPYDPVTVFLEFHTPGFTGSSDLPAAQEAIYEAASANAAAAVPEPSGILAMLMAFAVGGCLARKLLRQGERA